MSSPLVDVKLPWEAALLWDYCLVFAEGLFARESGGLLEKRKKKVAGISEAGSF